MTPNATSMHCRSRRQTNSRSLRATPNASTVVWRVKLKPRQARNDGESTMIGFSIQPIGRRVSPDIARKFRSLPVANVSDCMSRLTGGGPRLRPYHGGGVLSGPAFTVKTRPGDNLMVHKALDIASPGDVVVVDAGGDITNSLIGAIRVSHATTRGDPGSG